MTPNEAKYNVGDYVIISKKFVREPHGHMLECPPTIAEVVRVQDTTSLGPAYSLEINGERLSICYWETDIDRKVSKTFCATCECDPCDCNWGNY